MLKFNKKNWPLGIQHSLLPFTILIVSLLAYVFQQTLSDALVYQRQLIANGEFWRLFTGHFLHTNLNHLLLNLAALLLLWSLHGQFYSIRNFLALFLYTSLLTSLGLYYGSPELGQYVGLSGVLHGIFVWGAIQDISNRDKTGYLLLLGVALKVMHEQLFGASKDVAQLIGASVAIDAHLWGATAGLSYALLQIAYQRRRIIHHSQA